MEQVEKIKCKKKIEEKQKLGENGERSETAEDKGMEPRRTK